MVATVIAGDRQLSGEALDQRAGRGLSALERLGIRPGQVVCFMLRNDIATLEAMLAIRAAGCYTTPINWHFKADEAGHILRDSRAAALIVHADLLRQIAGAVPPGVQVIVVAPSPPLRQAFALAAEHCRVPPGMLDWERLLAEALPHDGPPRTILPPMHYSSGTTGRPKGIQRAALTQDQLARSLDNIRIGFGVEPGTRTAIVAPLYHSAPHTHAMNSLLQGELVIIHPRFEAEALLEAIERHRLTQLYLVPTMYVRLLKLPDAVRRRHDLTSVRFVGSTGSPCPVEVKRAMIEWWGPIFTESYASSETGLITFCTAADALARPGTAGRALPGAEIKILDDSGKALPPGEIGTIYCRHLALPDFTYINNPAARSQIDHGGLAAVGDMGYLDAEGYLFVCDRRSDMVISGGVNIYPAEIEAMLMTMPGVADCAVFGIPDPEYGEALAAHVQPQPDTTLDGTAVRDFLRQRLATYKVPQVVEFSAALPREDSGKIFKRKLREPYWQGVGRRI